MQHKYSLMEFESTKSFLLSQVDKICYKYTHINSKYMYNWYIHIAGLGSRSRKEPEVFGPWSRSFWLLYHLTTYHLRKNNQEPEPELLQKKRSRNGATKSMQLLYQLLEDKKH